MILAQVLRPESNDPRDVAAFVDARVAQANRELRAHIDARFDEQRQWFDDAFPGGDIAAHRIAHERQAEADADFKSLRRSLIEKGAFGLLAALVVMNWEAIKLLVKEAFR